MTEPKKPQAAKRKPSPKKKISAEVNVEVAAELAVVATESVAAPELPVIEAAASEQEAELAEIAAVDEDEIDEDVLDALLDAELDAELAEEAADEDDEDLEEEDDSDLEDEDDSEDEDLDGEAEEEDESDDEDSDEDESEDENADEDAEDEQVDAAEEQDADPDFVPKPRPPAKLERLQKILAQAGVASRRKAEEMIEQGRIHVNGKIVTELGTKADAGRDHIRVDGKLLQGAERLRYYVLNKPRGFVTTVKDPEGRPTVMQFFEKMRERLYPVGRLDYLSEGLLVVTNDGDLANRLTRAAAGVEKTYLVKVSGQPTEAELDQLRSGVSIERGKPGSARVRTSPARIRQVRQGDNPWYEVVLIEGRNRELRKMFEEVGHFVEKIRRVGYGPLVLDQEPGNLRELDEQEIDLLRKVAEGKLRTPKAKELRRRNALDAQLPTITPKRFANSFGKFNATGQDRPAGRERPAGKDYQPKRAFGGDRPTRSLSENRPAGDSSDRSSGFARPAGQDRPSNQDRSSSQDRPSYQDRRPGTYGPSKFGSARPTGGRPSAPPTWIKNNRSEGSNSGQDRSAGRDFGGNAEVRGSSERPAASGSYQNRPASRPFTARPSFNKPAFNRAGSDRPESTQPAVERPSAGGFADRPEKKSWSKPGGGDRSFDRPRPAGGSDRFGGKSRPSGKDSGRDFGKDSGKEFRKGKPVPFQRADDDYSDLEPRVPIKLFIEPIQDSERSTSTRSSAPRNVRPSAPRPYQERSAAPRSGAPRTGASRSNDRGGGDRGPSSERSGAPRPAQGGYRSDRPSFNRPYAGRPGSDRPSADRPSRPASDKPYGASSFRGEGGPGGSGLERRFTTSSGQPRAGGARPSSKPGKFGKPSGGPGRTGSRPTGGARSAGGDKPFVSRTEGVSDYRPTKAKPYPSSSTRAERKAGSEWKPKTRYGGGKPAGGAKSGGKPSGFKPKPGGKRPGGFSGKKRG